MTDPRTLIGQRFEMCPDGWGHGVYEARGVRDVEKGPFAQVGCRYVNHPSGNLDDKTQWFAAHDVADAIRILDEPEPRYPVSSTPPQSWAQKLIVDHRGHGDSPKDGQQ